MAEQCKTCSFHPGNPSATIVPDLTKLEHVETYYDTGFVKDHENELGVHTKSIYRCPVCGVWFDNRFTEDWLGHGIHRMNQTIKISEKKAKKLMQIKGAE